MVLLPSPPLLHSPSEKRPPALLFFADERGTLLPFPKDGEENTARRRAGKKWAEGPCCREGDRGWDLYRTVREKGHRFIFLGGGGGREVLGLREGRGISRKVKREGGRGSIESNPPFLSVSINFFDRPYVSNIFEK